MTWITIGLSAATMLFLAVVLTSVLGWANRRFHVEVDERVLAIIEALPGANCGGCGYVGCGEYAEAVALEHEASTSARWAGPVVRRKSPSSWGSRSAKPFPYRPIVHCGAILTIDWAKRIPGRYALCSRQSGHRCSGMHLRMSWFWRLCTGLPVRRPACDRRSGHGGLRKMRRVVAPAPRSARETSSPSPHSRPNRCWLSPVPTRTRARM